jgi:hypothetical protein
MFEYCGTQLKPEIAFRPSDPRCFGLCAALYQPHCPDFILCFFFHSRKYFSEAQTCRGSSESETCRGSESETCGRKREKFESAFREDGTVVGALVCKLVSAVRSCFLPRKVFCDRQGGCFLPRFAVKSHATKGVCVKQVCSSEDEIFNTKSDHFDTNTITPTTRGVPIRAQISALNPTFAPFPSPLLQQSTSMCADSMTFRVHHRVSARVMGGAAHTHGDDKHDVRLTRRLRTERGHPSFLRGSCDGNPFVTSRNSFLFAHRNHTNVFGEGPLLLCVSSLLASLSPFQLHELHEWCSALMARHSGQTCRSLRAHTHARHRPRRGYLPMLHRASNLSHPIHSSCVCAHPSHALLKRSPGTGALSP